MGEAADAVVTSGMHTGQVACRVMYRLAHHADTLYASIQAQKHSPEWNTAQAVIKQKRQQVELCASLVVTLSMCRAVPIPSGAPTICTAEHSTHKKEEMPLPLQVSDLCCLVAIYFPAG